MAYEMKEGQGSLFKNDEKEKPEHPDYRGQALVCGVEMWVSAWVKTAKSGQKYMSLAFKPKDTGVKRSKPPKDNMGAKDDFEDTSIPF